MEMVREGSHQPFEQERSCADGQMVSTTATDLFIKTCFATHFAHSSKNKEKENQKRGMFAN